MSSKKQGLFKPAKTVQKNMKVAIYGGPGVGKTQFALTWPKPATIDFEHGSDFFSGRFEFNVFHTKSAKEAFDAMVALEENRDGLETLIVDPVTMYWESIQEGYRANLKRRGKDRDIQFQDWAHIKRPMKAAMALWMNLPMHVLLVGRESNIYAMEGGELTVKGVAMAAEKTTPHFADVVMRMLVEGGKHYGEIQKDRSGYFKTGQRIESPTFEHFAPILEFAKTGERVTVAADDEVADKDADLFGTEVTEAEAILVRGRQIMLKMKLDADGMDTLTKDVLEDSGLTKEALSTIDGATAFVEALEAKSKKKKKAA